MQSIIYWEDLMSERKTFTVRMKPDIMKALKMLSVQEDTTVSDIIEGAVLEILKKSGLNLKKVAKK